MSLHFLSDQCVTAEITGTLRRGGHRTILLREVLPIRSPDPAVIAKAREMGAILISLNGDFADIVTYPPANYLGIVAIQLHNHPEIIPPTHGAVACLFENPTRAGILPRQAVPGRSASGAH